MKQALISIKDTAPGATLGFISLAASHGDALEWLQTNRFLLKPGAQPGQDCWIRTTDSWTSITFKKGLNGAGSLNIARAEGALEARITLLDTLPESGDVICEDR